MIPIPGRGRSGDGVDDRQADARECGACRHWQSDTWQVGSCYHFEDSVGRVTLKLRGSVCGNFEK